MIILDLLFLIIQIDIFSNIKFFFQVKLLNLNLYKFLKKVILKKFLL